VTAVTVGADRDRTAVLRIIDANVNRAGEGLRVVEDYARFVLDDAHLSRLCKELRHDLTEATLGLPAAERLAARDTLRDVGTEIATSAEYRRASVGEVLAANFPRIEQSLRCLEEYAKVLSPELAAKLEPLRYRTYTLARAVATTAESGQRLEHARLYVLVDGRPSQTAFADLVRTLVDAGVHVIQLRDKALTDLDLLARARVLRTLTRGTSTLFIINDRPDMAVLADADGVHVGQDELSVKDARTIVGPQRLIGVSTHSLDQARQAVLDGANYLGCGPTFPSATKSFDRFSGPDFLRAVSREITLPAFAIGGISPDNLVQVRATGFTRVAVSGAVVQAADPSRVVGLLLQGLA
jgi:thiamine-phosphate pyrophosphorylase